MAIGRLTATRFGQQMSRWTEDRISSGRKRIEVSARHPSTVISSRSESGDMKNHMSENVQVQFEVVTSGSAKLRFVTRPIASDDK